MLNYGLEISSIKTEIYDLSCPLLLELGRVFAIKLRQLRVSPRWARDFGVR